MKFSYEFRVDTHDTDLNGIATVSAVMRYMQETANLQHVVHGPTMEELRASGKAFILSRAALDLPVPLYPQDKLTSVSWLCEAKGYGYFRNTELLRNGKQVAAMSAFWGAIDIESRHPLRVEEIPLGFTPEAEDLTVEAPVRFRVPRDLIFAPLGEYQVLYGDCDMNIHMNNTNYPRIFCNFLPTMIGKRVTQFSINYMHEARLGGIFRVFGAEHEGAHIFRTLLEDEKTGAEARLLLTEL